MVILCFGDSLTAGYQSPSSDNPTGRETPYGHFLHDLLKGAVQVQVNGICGELTAEMVMRFRRDVLGHHPEYVVILGGTNDLGWNGRPSDIWKNLLKMYQLAQGGSITPVLVTVPSLRIEGADQNPDGAVFLKQHLTGRFELNGLIREYAESKVLPLVDLFAATADPATKQLAQVYSNDGLHLTTAGYRLFAQLLFSQVFATRFSPADPS